MAAQLSFVGSVRIKAALRLARRPRFFMLNTSGRLPGLRYSPGTGLETLSPVQMTPSSLLMHSTGPHQMWPISMPVDLTLVFSGFTLS